MIDVLKTLNEGNVLEVYILARFTYRFEKPIVEDRVYAYIENFLIKEGKDISEYLMRTYDEDPIPFELLKKYDMLAEFKSEIEALQNISEDFIYLEDKTRSILPLEGYLETYSWFNRMRGRKIVMMPKIDGVNTKTAYVNNLLRISSTRGRKGDALVITDNVRKILPIEVNWGDNLTHIVYAECIIPREYLQYFSEKYNKPFKTQKSGAISVLRVAVDQVDYSKVRVLVFKATNYGSTLVEMLEGLVKLGFDVVPYEVIENWPNNYEEFKVWVKPYMDKFWDWTQQTGYLTDGIVCELDDQVLFENLGAQHQYSEGSIALKFEHWSSKYYRGKVIEFLEEQQGEKVPLRARIEPLELQDGATAKVVSCYNHDIVIRNNVNIGSDIYFERKSETVSVMIYGERLRKLLNEGEDIEDVESRTLRESNSF